MESLIFSIKQKLPELTKTEQKIAHYVINNPTKVISMSVQELVSAIPTSSASIVRFAKIFCPNGFADFKLRLSAESELNQKIYDELDPKDSIDDLKDKLSFRINQTLIRTNSILDDVSLAKAIKILNRKETIVSFGIGASHLVAEDFQQKFFRIGKTVITNNDIHVIATILLAKKQQAAVLIISNSGETKEAINLARLAKQNKIPIIVLTHKNESVLAKMSDVVLIHDDSTENSSLRSAATTSLIAQFYAIDLLYYSYFKLDFSKHVKEIISSQKFIAKNFKEED
ncbi:MurR/RpiR family transcriptional regulator [Companilactobacillus pabuli]|jgi:DNA-binding MurR/RpiR family transcriptional regulator|uniref:MurR/RpiR family transcriptional regulator n=1 Tax=Companilactobacillus pabuli TaxID=2714036 RepID=A0A7L7KW05_9LACO|nr:MurR/RpiR family transcriptional regulator [Companilactobacillus pabuli]AKP03945.1 RpiR family transcriptional regulator [Companilactobacillus farciminis]AKS52250.1 RpiR family transcriptional regulator [Companilactobacillus farciminis]MDG5113193.1 MurR/RpiR family transcriptional regulator [Companilactobacillus pabuli]QMT83993.1 MurR/RpiR family transcriptional regulator [Companilactobacillus pabuli]